MSLFGLNADLSAAQARVIGMELLTEKGYADKPDYVADLEKAIDATYANGVVFSDDPAGKISISKTPFVKYWPNSYGMIGSGLEKKGYFLRPQSRGSAPAAAAPALVSEPAVESAFTAPTGTPVRGKLTVAQLQQIIRPFAETLTAIQAARVAKRLERHQSGGGTIYIPSEPVGGGWKMFALFGAVVVVLGVVGYAAFKRR